MKKGNLLLVLLGTVVMISCLKDKYGTKEIKLDYSPTVALPLIDANVITKDLLEGIDTSVISAGADDVLQVVFHQEVKSIGLSEFISLGSQSIKDTIALPPVAVDDITKKDSMALQALSIGSIDFLASDGKSEIISPIAKQSAGSHSIANIGDFTSLTFSKGQLVLDITNNYPMDITNLEFELKSGSVIIDTLRFPSVAVGETKSDNSDLKGKVLGNSMDLNIISFESPGTAVAVVINANDQMLFTVKISNAEIIAGQAPIPSQDLVTESFDMDLGLTKGEELQKVKFTEMTMDYTIKYGVQENSSITISLPHASKDGGPSFSKVIPISPGATATGSLDLAGYTFDLTAGGTGFNKIKAEIKASIISSGSHVVFDTTQVVSYDFTMGNMKIETVEGYFGKQDITFTDEEVSTGLSDDELLKSLKLVSPEIKMSFENSFGLPMSFDTLRLQAKGGTSDVTVDMEKALKEFSDAGGVKRGTVGSAPVKSILNVNSTNTNIAEAINAQAKKFVVGGNAVVNPAGNTTGVNKADTTSKLSVGLDVTVPMHGTIKGMYVLDTMELDFGAIAENAEMIILKSVITNEFPLNGEIQMYFADSTRNYLVLDSLVQKDGVTAAEEAKFLSEKTFMAATEVDANGVTKKDASNKFIGEKKENKFTLTQETLAKLGTSTHIIIRVKISSGNGGTDVMKILSTYNMNIKLGLIAKVQLGGLGGDE